MARKRFRYCRRTYFGKFSSRVSTLSGQARNISSIVCPTARSTSVRYTFRPSVTSRPPPREVEASPRIDTRYCTQRRQQDLHIRPQRSMSQIFKTEPHLLRRDSREVCAVRIVRSLQEGALIAKQDRRVIGHARPDGKQFTLSVRIECYGPCNLRPRPDQTHLASEHVEQLRQFVDLVLAQDTTNPRDPRIIVPG